MGFHQVFELRGGGRENKMGMKSKTLVYLDLLRVNHREKALSCCRSETKTESTRQSSVLTKCNIVCKSDE